MPLIDPKIFFQQNERELTNKSQQIGIQVFKDEENNLEYTKQRVVESILDIFNGSMFGGSVNGDWMSAVEQMGRWYESNIHTHQNSSSGKATGQKGWFMCPLINDKVADDCSGFVQACLKLFGIRCPVITTSIMQPSSQFDQLMRNSGFTYYSGIFTPDNLQPGDIICGRASTHTEIYAGDKKSWSWGSIHDGQNGHSGMPCGFCRLDKRGGYINCWRKS